MGYFKPWRRNIGIVMLIVATISVVAWVRSFMKVDIFNAGGAYLISSAGSLDFGISTFPRDTPPGFSDGPMFSYSSHEQEDTFYGAPWGESHQIEWRLDYLEFHIGVATLVDSNQRPIRKDHSCVIPYWSILIPLTLLSAWLLLSKIRNPKPQPEPAPPKA